MTLETLRLTLNPSAESYSYDVTMIDTVDLDSRKEAFSIAAPGLSAAENVLLGVSGMQADISLNFSIHNDGTDKANGSYTSQVVTQEEQITYLEDVIHAPDFNASWQLDHVTGDAFNDDEVFVENVAPTVISQGSPKWKPCRIRLRRGQSI